MDNKSSMFNIKNFVKNSNIPNQRLASLKLPRDLNLGGNKPKKVYAPNLNVIRNKEKSKEQVKRSEINHNRRNNERRNHNKHKEINASRYVQSSGIFSEGTADIKRPSQGFGGRISNYSERDNVASIVMPKLNRNSWNVNKNEEATIASDLMVYNEHDDDSSTDVEYEPVILPLDKNDCKFSKNFSYVNDGIKIKEEKLDFPDSNYNCNTTKILSNNFSNFAENGFSWIPTCSFNVKRKFTDEENIMSLIRLPDSLPGKAFSEESDKIEDLTIDQLVEGEIGKIIVRKSGKMEVVIANTKYHLDSEEPSCFTEEVVMFPGSNSTSLDNSVVCLGPLEEKFALTPNWDCLFQQKKL